MRIATAHASRIGAVALALALTVHTLPSAAFGAPNTPEIEAKQEEALSAQAELERMNVELEIRVEEYNALTESLERTREDILLTQAELERAREELDAAQETLSRRATSIYKGGATDALEVFLGARSFTDFLTLLDLAVRISNADAAMVAEVEAAKSRVEATVVVLEQRQAEQVSLQSEAEARARQIQADVESQERFVGRLNTEVRALIAAEEERLRKLAEERARQAAAAAAAAAARGSSSGRSRSGGPIDAGGRPVAGRGDSAPVSRGALRLGRLHTERLRLLRAHAVLLPASGRVPAADQPVAVLRRSAHRARSARLAQAGRPRLLRHRRGRRQRPSRRHVRG